MASYIRISVNDEIGKTLRMTFMAYLKLLSQNSPDDFMEN